MKFGILTALYAGLALNLATHATFAQTVKDPAPPKVNKLEPIAPPKVMDHPM